MSDYYPYPVFINMRDRSCIVVGGGKVALRKISDLLETGAKVTVVAETPDPNMGRLLMLWIIPSIVIFFPGLLLKEGH